MRANTAAIESLVIAPQWLGDAVMTEPLLRRLSARGERVSVAALPAIAPVYRCMPHVAEVIELPFAAHGALEFGARRKLGRQFDGRFQRAYVLPNSIKSALLPWLAGIPERIGYLGEARVGLLTHRLKNPGKGERPAMVPFYSALSGEADVAGDVPQLSVPEAEVAAFLAAHNLQRGEYHVFAPGSEYGPAKRWPAAHYGELAKLMIERDGLPIVLLGSPKEREIGAEIVQRASNLPQVLNFIGNTSLVQAFACISATKSVVSNDSGLMHVAAALRIPQIAIFGSSSPDHTPPLNPAAKIVWLKRDLSYQPPLDCAPCFERECRFGHTRCLADVTAVSALPV